MNKTTTHQPKGNQKINPKINIKINLNRFIQDLITGFNYTKAFLLAMSLLLIVNCSDDKSPSANDGNVVVQPYAPPDSETIPNNPDTGTAFGSWADAIKHYQTDEYKASGGADQINAAYAYARGYAATSVTVSVVGEPVHNRHQDLSGQLFEGYDADNDDATATIAGQCSTDSCEGYSQGTHVAGIIGAILDTENPNTGIQGIAYGAIMKPIDIMTGNDVVDEAKRIKAIDQATNFTTQGGFKIVVMNNSWDIPTTATYGVYSYAMASDPNAISVAERNAWADGAVRTIVVFAAGDQGHNSVNGMVQLYDDAALEMKATEDDGEGGTRDKKVAWATIDASNGVRNLASSHARLGVNARSGASSFRSELRDNLLSVIALDSNNVIAPFSNGCGDTKDYCLAAPGLDIYSTTPGGYGKRSGTAQATAHVTGALAVLRKAFPSLTRIQLVRLILDTADDLGAPGVDDVYGHGRLNLARATEQMQSQ